jgi:CubicO group peptidase (beta-lactamase class C family)
MTNKTTKKQIKKKSIKTKKTVCRISDVNNSVIYRGSSIVYDNGKITRTNYKSTSDTMYQIGSCSKFITAILVAKLYELGKLDYDTDINKYLKKWKCPQKGITLKHLLTHTSGSSDGNGYLGESPQRYLEQNLDFNIKIINGEWSLGTRFNITDKPGKKFMYSGAGFQVIQQVLEEITNERLYKLMEKYLFNPLNMHNSTGKLLYEGEHNYSLADMDGLYRMHLETAAAGVWMSCNDLLTFTLDLMNSYNNNSGKILKKETIQLITKNYNTGDKKLFEKWSLGMEHVEDEDGNRKFGHSGGLYGNQMDCYCIPDKNYINIFMINNNPKVNFNCDKVKAKAVKKLKLSNTIFNN